MTVNEALIIVAVTLIFDALYRVVYILDGIHLEMMRSNRYNETLIELIKDGLKDDAAPDSA